MLALARRISETGKAREENWKKTHVVIRIKIIQVQSSGGVKTVLCYKGVTVLLQLPYVVFENVTVLLCLQIKAFFPTVMAARTIF